MVNFITRKILNIVRSWAWKWNQLDKKYKIYAPVEQLEKLGPAATFPVVSPNNPQNGMSGV